MSFSPDIYTRLSQHKFILASTSIRRLEILTTNLGIPLKSITIIAPDFEENLLKEGISASEYVNETSKHKGLAVIEQLKMGLNQQDDVVKASDEDIIILTSDTVISCDEKIFEKPGNKQTQFEMLKYYQKNKKLEVLTSINLIKLNKNHEILKWESDLEITKLKFNLELDDDFLNSYIDCEEGLNVAGGFKYQSIGSLLFNGIDGDYFNVVGLPVSKTFQLLNKVLA